MKPETYLFHCSSRLALRDRINSSLLLPDEVRDYSPSTLRARTWMLTPHPGASHWAKSGAFLGWIRTWKSPPCGRGTCYMISICIVHAKEILTPWNKSPCVSLKLESVDPFSPWSFVICRIYARYNSRKSLTGMGELPNWRPVRDFISANIRHISLKYKLSIRETHT